jgi:hypothetical protein
MEYDRQFPPTQGGHPLYYPDDPSLQPQVSQESINHLLDKHKDFLKGLETFKKELSEQKG